MNRKQIIWGVLGAVSLVLITAGASALVTREMVKEDKTAVVKERVAPKTKVTWDEPRQQPQPQKVARNCNDGNIVGTVVGGVGGGIIGNQIGSGSGNTVATIGGAVGGAALGNRYIPTQNVTCAN